MNALAADCQINIKRKGKSSDRVYRPRFRLESCLFGALRLLFLMNYLLQICLIIEIRAVGGVVALCADHFIYLFQTSAHVGVAFRGTVAGFTLDVFQIPSSLGRITKTRRMAGKAEGIVRFPLIRQGLIGMGVACRGPLLMLFGVAGHTAFSPYVCGQYGDDDMTAESSRRGGRGCRGLRLSEGLQAGLVVLQ